MDKTLFSSFLCLVLLILSTNFVHADELVIAGNGESSNIETQTESNNNQDIQQTNNGQIKNIVETNNQTGGNKASNNSNGLVEIKTGNIVSTTNVINTPNLNQALTTCCPQDQNSQDILGNGSNSKTGISYTSQSTLTGTQNNNTLITNTITIYADTGNNTAKRNNGNVTIQTGSIFVDTSIQNHNINAHSNTFGISNNALKANEIASNLTNTNSLNSTNNTNIANAISHDLNTGINKAFENNGSVIIATGNIQSATTIKNQDINNNTAIECCKNEEQKPPVGGEIPKPTQSNPPTGNSGGVGNGGSGIGVFTTGTTKEVLPITGSYFLFLALIFHGIMFLCGGLLRLLSGRSPGFSQVSFAYSIQANRNVCFFLADQSCLEYRSITHYNK